MDLYKLLTVNRDAQIKEIKNSYYHMARIYHPDRVDESEKENAKNKFNILHRAYSILTNADTKSRYDAGDFRVLNDKIAPIEKWDHYIRIVDSSDIECARRRYQDSSREEGDILREFVHGNGSMTHLMNTIPFMRLEDEPRIIHFVKRSIGLGKIPKIPIRKIRN